MKRIKELNPSTKAILGLSLLLLIYSFSSRIIPINFFWESKSIGWILLLSGLLSLLINEIKNQKKINKKAVGQKIGIGLICFILLIQIIFMAVIPNTDAYKAAKDFVSNNEELKSELGEINGFGLISTGGISVQSNANGETGNANINLIIKGEKAFKSVTVYVFKDYGQDWAVYEME